MNHLVGVIPAADAIESMLTDETERESLRRFKAMYAALADADPGASPSWEVDPDTLPASGWRALDDITLLRFLRADKRKGQFDHTASMARLTKALAWRKQMGSDRLLSVPADESYELLRIRRWVGHDKSGRPVQFERLGNFLSSGNSKAFTGAEWLRHYARDLETTFEQMRLAAKAKGEQITAYSFAADFAGGAGIVWHMSSVIPLLKLLTKEVEAHFPEIVGRIIIFNAPRIFASIFPLVKAFMDPITAAKVEVYAGVPLDKLLEIMPAESIPVEYGGSNNAPYPQTSIHDAGASTPRQVRGGEVEVVSAVPIH